MTAGMGLKKPPVGLQQTVEETRGVIENRHLILGCIGRYPQRRASVCEVRHGSEGSCKRLPREASPLAAPRLHHFVCHEGADKRGKCP